MIKLATIDSTTFNLTGLTITASHNLNQSHVPGKVTNPIHDLGYSGLQLRISGLAESRTEYDSVIAAFLSPGEHVLVVDSGWQYLIHSAQLSRRRAVGHSGHIPWQITAITDSPYVQSTAEVTRTKTISSNNQTWSADNSSDSISTTGNVAAVPSIQIEAGNTGSTYRWPAKKTTTTDATEFNTSSSTYVLKKTATLSAISTRAHNLISVGGDLHGYDDESVTGKVTYTAASLNGGAETTITEWTEEGGTYVSYEEDCDILAAVNEALVIKWYMKSGRSGWTVSMENCTCTSTENRPTAVVSPEVYNTADENTKCEVGNFLQRFSTMTINADGTGSYEYEEDPATNKYQTNAYESSSVSYSMPAEYYTIADGGYIVYDFDLKYPVTGIPTLTADINITSGTPTIQIALDDGGVPGTWHDIDTAIVDHVETEYELVSGDYNFKGETTVWVRIDCTGSGTVTASVYSLKFGAELITIDARMPEIETGGVNTFQCDQSSASNCACDISLIYNHRKWA